MVKEIDHLREIHRLCVDGEELSPDLSRWLGEALENFLTRRSKSIDEAFGLRFPKGGVPWWMEEAMLIRDAALRQLAERFYPEASVGGQAKDIAVLSVRYAASAWRCDCEYDHVPADYAGTVKEYLWIAFQSGAAMPLGERQLRSILGR